MDKKIEALLERVKVLDTQVHNQESRALHGTKGEESLEALGSLIGYLTAEVSVLARVVLALAEENDKLQKRQELGNNLLKEFEDKLKNLKIQDILESPDDYKIQEDENGPEKEDDSETAG